MRDAGWMLDAGSSARSAPFPSPGECLQTRWRGAVPPAPAWSPRCPDPAATHTGGWSGTLGVALSHPRLPRVYPELGLSLSPLSLLLSQRAAHLHSHPSSLPRQSCPRPTVPGWRWPVTCRSSSPATGSAHEFTRYPSYHPCQISSKSCRGVGQRIAGGRQRQEKHGEGLGPLVGDAGVACRVPGS